MLAAGFVLVGGNSRRMGRDKALLPYAGATLVESVAAQVRAAVGSVTLIGESAAERYAGLCLPAAGEDFPGCGPMSGIEAGLRLNFAPLNVIAACDLPGLKAAWLLDLLALARENPEADAIVPEAPDGRLQPLCAVWHVRSHAALRASLESGKFKLVNVLDQIVTVRASLPWVELLRNVNTPEDWAGLAAPEAS